MQTEGAISLNRTILLLHFGRGDSCTQNRTHLYSRVTWTRTQVQFPSYRTPSSSHTPLQTLLSVFFPPECRGQVSHTDPFHLLYRRKINLPHLLLKSLWFQLCQGGDLFSSCRNISDIVWPKHELVANRTLSQSLACFFLFFFFRKITFGTKKHMAAPPLTAYSSTIRNVGHLLLWIRPIMPLCLAACVPCDVWK